MRMRSLNGMCWLLFAMSTFGLGCSSTLKVKRIDPATGYFPAQGKLVTEEYIVRKNIDLAPYRKLLYVRSDQVSESIQITNFRDFAKQGFTNLEFFESVKDRRDMEAYVLGKGLGGKITNISDMLGLHQLQKEIGPFLVADYNLKWLSRYDYEFEVVLMRPEDGQTVLHIRRKVLNWAGLDGPLFYPVFNGIKDWITENSTRPASP